MIRLQKTIIILLDLHIVDVIISNVIDIKQYYIIYTYSNYYNIINFATHGYYHLCIYRWYIYYPIKLQTYIDYIGYKK